MSTTTETQVVDGALTSGQQVTISNPAANGVLDDLTLTTLPMMALFLLMQGYLRYRPGISVARRTLGDIPTRPIKGGSDGWSVSPAWVSIPDASSHTLAICGLVLRKDVNAFDTGSSASTTKYFVSFDSIETVATITLKGATTSS